MFFLACVLTFALAGAAPPLTSLENLDEVLRTAANTSHELPRLYAIGGNEGGAMRAVEAFNLPQGTTKISIAPLPSGRQGHGTATAGGLIYVVGGMEGGSNYLATVDVYIPSLGRESAWYSTTPMNYQRFGLGVCAFAGKVYAIGGQNQSHGVLNTAEVYDTTSRVWRPIASMSMKRYFHGVGVLRDYIYAVGGYGDEELSSVERYTPAADQWSFVAPMQIKKYHHSVAVLFSRIMYAIGGVTVGEDYLSSVEVYDPESDSWSYGKEMPTERARAGVVTFGHSIYIVGGQNMTRRLDSVIQFFKVRSMWTRTPIVRLSEPRDSVSAVVL